MDGSVERTTDRTLISAAAARGRVKGGKHSGNFQLESESSENPEPEAQIESEDEVLPVGEATYDEAGKRLDVTG